MTLLELETTTSTSAYLRAAQLSLLFLAGAATQGGVRAGYHAYAQGKTPRAVAWAAIGGFNTTFSRPELYARVLLSAAVVAVGGPVGLAVLAGIGAIESGMSYCDARQAQEQATTQADLDLATFDAVLSGLTFVANAASLAGAAYATRPLKQLQYRGRSPRTLNERLALEEAESGTGQVIMENLNDPGLQAVRKGHRVKKAHIRYFNDGDYVEVHTSMHVETGLVWDIKIKHPR